MSFSKKVLALVTKYNAEELNELELGEALYELDTDSNGIYGAYEDAFTQLEQRYVEDFGLTWNDELNVYTTESGENYGEYEGPSDTNDWHEFFEQLALNVLKQVKALKKRGGK